jgi:hypothetical protein
MHCVLNGTNLGIRSLFYGVMDSTLIWDTIPILFELQTLCYLGIRSLFLEIRSLFSLSYRLYVTLGYNPCAIEIRVSVQSAYAYIYHGVFVCTDFMICIFLFAWFKKHWVWMCLDAHIVQRLECYVLV